MLNAMWNSVVKRHNNATENNKQLKKKKFGKNKLQFE